MFFLHAFKCFSFKEKTQETPPPRRYLPLRHPQDFLRVRLRHSVEPLTRRDQPSGRCSENQMRWGDLRLLHLTVPLLCAPADEGLWDILIKDIPKEVTSYTFSMDILKPGVSYDFRVIAVNDYGFGTPSSPSQSVPGTSLEGDRLEPLESLMTCLGWGGREGDRLWAGEASRLSSKQTVSLSLSPSNCELWVPSLM